MAEGKYLLVANPTAQSGRNADRIAKARRILDGLGLRHAFLATEPEGGTVEAVRKRLDEGGFHTAIAMGGDGTFAEVARGILASERKGKLRLAMLPTGTANDQGKSFGLSSHESALAANAEVIAAGYVTLLDVGRLTFGESALLFFDSAGWGFSALVLARRNRDRETVSRTPFLKDLWRDQAVYAGALMRSIVEPGSEARKFDARVVADGETTDWRGLLDLVVKGTPIYAGEWVLDRDAKHDDGKFEVVPFTGRRDLVSKALLQWKGAGKTAELLASMGVSPSEGVSGAKISIELSAPTEAQADGEELPRMSRFEVEVLKRELRLVVPEPKGRSRGHKG